MHRKHKYRADVQLGSGKARTWRRHRLFIDETAGRGRAETGTGNRCKSAYSNTAAWSSEQVYIARKKQLTLERDFCTSQRLLKPIADESKTPNTESGIVRSGGSAFY